jgi:DNA (cytosine-5)-methyltransferase 1
MTTDCNESVETAEARPGSVKHLVMPRLLDLFCGVGGAGEGYRQAGFDVTGVDIKPQKNNPHRFVLSDALEYVAEHGSEYDAIHASPPCQAYSMAAQTQRNRGKVYPDLLAVTRCALQKTGRPWVIENVPGAPMRPDFKLCGCQFGMNLRRERWFETSWHAFALLPSCHHPFPVVSVVGHGTPTWVREKLGYNPTIKHYREAMGIDWMNREELSQAIPPTFTEYIGRYLRAEVERHNDRTERQPPGR